jgi:tubulin-folding cofactor B
MLSTSAMLNALPGDKASVRRYVTAAASTSLADGTVAVNVSHSNLRQLVQELRFDLHSLIGDVKRRLYTFNGSSQASMELHLKDSDGNLLARMLDETKPLGYYGVTSGMNIHVVDTDPFSLSRDGG